MRAFEVIAAVKAALERNPLLRSILFSAFSKGVAALTVAVGIPVIAHVLSLDDYAIFLHSISTVTLLGFLFWPLQTTTITELAKSIDRDHPEYAVLPSLRPFLFVGAITIAATLIAYASGLTWLVNPFVVLALLLTALQMTATWAESWRLARRSDHITSIYQAAGSALMVVTLLLANSSNLYISGIIFYGVPLLVSLASMAAVFRGMRWERMRDNARHVRIPIGRSFGLVFVALPDYSRIYGVGWLLGSMVPVVEYAKYFTIILFLARFVSPISLVTRPLLPAYLHALRDGDDIWLRRANIAVISSCVVVLLVLPLGLVLVSPILTALPVLPAGWGLLTTWDLMFFGLYFSAALVSAVVAPFYLGTGRSLQYAVIGNLANGFGLLVGALLVPQFGAGAVLYCVSTMMTLAATLYLALMLRVGRVKSADENAPAVRQ